MKVTGTRVALIGGLCGAAMLATTFSQVLDAQGPGAGQAAVCRPPENPFPGPSVEATILVKSTS